jgi:hypothetical protein
MFYFFNYYYLLSTVEGSFDTINYIHSMNRVKIKYFKVYIIRVLLQSNPVGLFFWDVIDNHLDLSHLI